ETYPLLSANLCEALVQMRPGGDRPRLTVSAVWSRWAPPSEHPLTEVVRLEQESFALAEDLAPRLRSAPHRRLERFIGFLDVPRGQPGPDDRPSGEVMVTICQEDELLRAWLYLSADDYAVANEAHMTNLPVLFRGVLYRSPRVGRVEQVGNFQRLEPERAEPT